MELSRILWIRESREKVTISVGASVQRESVQHQGTGLFSSKSLPISFVLHDHVVSGNAPDLVLLLRSRAEFLQWTMVGDILRSHHLSNNRGPNDSPSRMKTVQYCIGNVKTIHGPSMRGLGAKRDIAVTRDWDGPQWGCTSDQLHADAMELPSAKTSTSP